MTALALATTACIPIASEADIVKARVEGRALAARAGLCAGDARIVATTIGELARNILLYAGAGEIAVTPLEGAGRSGVLVVASDQGPGVADVAQALSGGYSTSGGLGLGLSGVRGLVDEFEMLSESGRGTTVIAKKYAA